MRSKVRRKAKMLRNILGAVSDIVSNATSPTGGLNLSPSSFFRVDAGPDVDPNLIVQELAGTKQSELVAKFPIYQRHRSLMLHGPINDRTMCRTKFNIILHVAVEPPSNRELMFSLIRTDNLEDAQRYFIIFKECIVPLVDIDTQICTKTQLEKMCPVLRQNPGWSAVHTCAAFNLCNNYITHPSIVTSVNMQEGVEKKTPLHIAIMFRNLEIVNVLLSLNVRLDLTDDNLNTVIHQAVSSPDTSPMILERVLTECETVNPGMKDAMNGEALTALHIACRQNKPELVQVLLQAGANVNIPNKERIFPIHMAVKSRSVCTIEEIVRRNKDQLLTRDLKDGGTPLHWAQGPEIMALLLELGCDPNIVDNNGRSALHNAIQRGDLRSTLMLLSHRGYADMTDDNGCAPLHVAAKLCSRDLIKALIVFRADINKKNKDGHTPRHLVCTSGKPEKDVAECLFFLDRVGALRCSGDMQDECTPGCSATGDFSGTKPLNITISPDSRLIDQALSAFSINTNAQRRVDREEERLFHRRNQHDLDETIGGRLLCLDGGGIRGLVLIQVLMVLEDVIGYPINQLFDWVSGTSTGGIVALGMATGKTVEELQALYMRLKDSVFGGTKPYSAEKMEEFLKKEFGEEMRMCDIQRPRLMITTTLVDARPAEFHFFRNYMSPSSILNQNATEEPGLNEYVWQVAKWTGAAPSFFRLDGSRYIDGGLISNNPTLDAMTELTQFGAAMKAVGDCRERNCQIPTVVVSLGCGIQPRQPIDPQSLDVSIPRGLFEAMSAISRLPTMANLLVDQATQSEGQIVERARAWCSNIGVPFYRYSPMCPVFVDLDETKDEVLVDLMWLTRAYVLSDKAKLMELKQTLLQNAPEHLIVQE